MRKRVCFVLQVRPERLAEYKERHEAVAGDARGASENRLAQLFPLSEVNRRWQRRMAGYFEFPEGTHADDQMRPIPEIFHLE